MIDIVTAGILVIGDEILSGRTKDKNIGFIAEYLTNIGIDLKEVRVVSDDEDDIIAALDALRKRYTYVFTTGGIGPTHDDITADAVGAAFGLPVREHPEALAILARRYAPGEFNAARRRMARVPEGGVLIANPVSDAPGFQVDNVFVMAGVPKIMEAMLDDVAPRLKTGAPVHSRSLRVTGVGEGAVAKLLRAAAEARPHLSFGSYLFGFGAGQTADEVGTQLVIRGRDQSEVDAAEHDLTANLRSSGIEIAAT